MRSNFAINAYWNEKEKDTMDTSREKLIIRTSGIGIAINLVLAVVKILVGVATSSIAILSEGVNSLTDALSSTLAFIGTKLSKKHPDEKHPFGYGRIEYLTGLTVSILIIVTGFEMLTGSIQLVIHPEELSISYVSLAIVAVSAVIKFCLGGYTIKVGRKTESSALQAVGLECRNDSFGSIITIISALVFLLLGYSLDAYAGILISLLIIKAGIGVLSETLSEIIGRPGEHEMAKKLYHEIRKTPGIVAAADMMLHNYGPERWSGSVNLEIDHNKTVGEIYSFLHALQLRIMHEYGVTLVFGIYAVDNEHEEIRAVRKVIADFVKNHAHVESFHAVYIDDSEQKLYCDFIVDYALLDWNALNQEFKEYFQKYYPQMQVDLTIETEFV